MSQLSFMIWQNDFAWDSESIYERHIFCNSKVLLRGIYDYKYVTNEQIVQEKYVVHEAKPVKDQTNEVPDCAKQGSCAVIDSEEWIKINVQRTTACEARIKWKIPRDAFYSSI